jgi:O-antigen chain-terminating methyltransferase
MVNTLIAFPYRLIKLIPKFIKGIKDKIQIIASLNGANHILIKENYSTGSYFEVFKNSELKIYKMQEKDEEDAFYFLFENLFRGSIEEIKKRQSIYLPYVTEAHANSKGSFFLDAGCGRGEFLSLLDGHGVPARGVEINRLAIDLVKKGNIDVMLSDAFEYLKGLEDRSLIGLSMFQVIEHLDFKRINDILKTAFKKISPNGIIILESVNPYCPVALGNFYLDPNHIRPYAPDLMKFMLEWHGFEKVKIIYSSLIPNQFKKAVRNYQDYAVLGKKMKV